MMNIIIETLIDVYNKYKRVKINYSYYVEKSVP